MKKGIIILLAMVFAISFSFAQTNQNSTTQSGHRNISNVTQNGTGNNAVQTQSGNENTADVSQDSDRNNSNITQGGNKNAATALQRSGAEFNLSVITPYVSLI